MSRTFRPTTCFDQMLNVMGVQHVMVTQLWYEVETSCIKRSRIIPQLLLYGDGRRYASFVGKVGRLGMPEGLVPLAVLRCDTQRNFLVW